MGVDNVGTVTDAEADSLVHGPASETVRHAIEIAIAIAIESTHALAPAPAQTDSAPSPSPDSAKTEHSTGIGFGSEIGIGWGEVNIGVEKGTAARSAQAGIDPLLTEWCVVQQVLDQSEAGVVSRGDWKERLVSIAGMGTSESLRERKETQEKHRTENKSKIKGRIARIREMETLL
jgi:hypothetical protein